MSSVDQALLQMGHPAAPAVPLRWPDQAPATSASMPQVGQANLLGCKSGLPLCTLGKLQHDCDPAALLQHVSSQVISRPHSLALWERIISRVMDMLFQQERQAEGDIARVVKDRHRHFGTHHLHFAAHPRPTASAAVAAGLAMLQGFGFETL